MLSGSVNGSFVTSARAAGLSGGEISAVIKALQWQMDFRKLRKGDQFSVLMSREMMDGKSEQSQLVGVRMQTGGKDYYAIRAADGKFYDRNGNGLARGFMRFPTTKQYRVSSNFNPRRLNPVTGRIAPHKGVDFALPIGTPVLAVGDGEVIVAKRSGGAGNYVAVRHGRQYMTRYMHLKTLLVKPRTESETRRSHCAFRQHRTFNRPASPFRNLDQQPGGQSADGEDAADGRIDGQRPFNLSGAGTRSDATTSLQITPERL